MNSLLNFLRRGKIRVDRGLMRLGMGRFRSETSKCRPRLAPYCRGSGVDLGYGGDPIVEHAVRVDLPSPYTQVGTKSVQLGGDATKLVWFRDDCLDFAFSSHLLEDFADTTAVLREWLRVLKPGGLLIIFCPDQPAYEAYCRRHRRPPNPHHVHADFSLRFVLAAMPAGVDYEIVHQQPLVDEYSWELVVRKRGAR